MTARRTVPLALLLCCFVVAGCSKGIPLAAVEGTVKVKGKPMADLAVEFYPQGKQGQRSSGKTDANGRYTLTTNDGKSTGAVVGTHKVVVTDASLLGNQFVGRDGDNKDLTQGKKSRVSPQYGDPMKTPLEKKVGEQKNVIDLDL